MFAPRPLIALAMLALGCSDEADQPSSEFDYEGEQVELKSDLVIPVGKTVRVGPGVTFHAADGAAIRVLGILDVAGSTEAPVAFTGGGAPSTWHGVVVEPGGELRLSHARISDASYGIYSEPGARFTVTDSVIDTSFKAAVIESGGSFTNTHFIASVPPTIAITDEVGVDDPNGTLTIIDASPTITNCRFDGASPFTDLVRIGGQSSPTFDHVTLRNAHCAFHTFGGVNTSPRITHALIENFSYGFMAYKTKPIVENSVFRDNGSDFGLCSGATADNAPTLSGNFFHGGTLRLDASCDRIGTREASPAASANASAGATGF
jgi:hypothetical protein